MGGGGEHPRDEQSAASTVSGGRFDPRGPSKEFRKGNERLLFLLAASEYIK